MADGPWNAEIQINGNFRRTHLADRAGGPSSVYNAPSSSSRPSVDLASSLQKPGNSQILQQADQQRQDKSPTQALSENRQKEQHQQQERDKGRAREDSPSSLGSPGCPADSSDAAPARKKFKAVGAPEKDKREKKRKAAPNAAVTSKEAKLSRGRRVEEEIEEEEDVEQPAVERNRQLTKADRDAASKQVKKEEIEQAEREGSAYVPLTQEQRMAREREILRGNTGIHISALGPKAPRIARDDVVLLNQNFHAIAVAEETWSHERGFHARNKNNIDEQDGNQAIL